MNAALDYIEDRLTGKIDLREAAARACCSEYHFSRMFAFITDVPLGEYVRRRRLTQAGLELKNSGVKIIDWQINTGTTRRIHSRARLRRSTACCRPKRGAPRRRSSRIPGFHLLFQSEVM